MTSIHIDPGYANNTPGACRILLADLICLALRDEVDIITGDFDKSGSYLEEVVINAVMYHEEEKELPGELSNGTF